MENAEDLRDAVYDEAVNLYKKGQIPEDGSVFEQASPSLKRDFEHEYGENLLKRVESYVSAVNWMFDEGEDLYQTAREQLPEEIIRGEAISLSGINDLRLTGGSDVSLQNLIETYPRACNRAAAIPADTPDTLETWIRDEASEEHQEMIQHWDSEVPDGEGYASRWADALYDVKESTDWITVRNEANVTARNVAEGIESEIETPDRDLREIIREDWVEKYG